MNPRSTVLAEYLRARRARLDPVSAGFIDDGRRVPGLRREELASLAGISRDYYVRLEQGRHPQVSHQVLRSLAAALHLDSAEQTYLYRIARPGFTPVPTIPERTRLSETVLSLLHTWSDVPAYITDSNQDIVAINEMADLVVPGFARFGDNFALAAFANVQFECALETAHVAVAALRFHGDPDNRRFQEVVGELSTTNAVFRRLWSEFDVRPLTAGTVSLSIDGEPVEFPWQILEVPGGFFMTVWPVEKGTRGDELLARLRANDLTGRPIRGPLEGWPAS